MINTSDQMNVMNKFLIYRNSKGETSAFEVEPKYIKGNNFAAKNLENGRQKSFSMNLTIGLFDTQKEVDSTLKTIESNKIATAKLEAQLEAQRERLTTKVEELRAKAQKLEDQAERLSDRAERKDESMERAEDKGDFDRAEELEKESEVLGDRSSKLEDEAYKFSEEADKIEDEEWEESEKLEEEIGKLSYDYFEQLASQTKAKIEALGLEVKVVIPRPKPTSMPEPQSQVSSALSPLPKTDHRKEELRLGPRRSILVYFTSLLISLICFVIARTQGQFKPENLYFELANMAWGVSAIVACVAALVAVGRLIQSIFKLSKVHFHAALSWLAIPLFHTLLVFAVVSRK